ncbi:MAG: hypothetical protein HY925_08900 [Elusimicrobia bacterium]|nr:hypothetical protein [Elusimicrobiota bacterium]
MLMKAMLSLLFAGPLFANPRPSREEAPVLTEACRDAKMSRCENAVELLFAADAKRLDKMLDMALRLLPERGGEPARAAALSYWIAKVVEARQSDGMGSFDKARADALIGMGLDVEHLPIGDAWVASTSPLLRDAAESKVDTGWSGAAFLGALRKGWNENPTCKTGSDTFRVVIEKGEEYLKTHPKSPVAAAVKLEVGRAYATWWSLSTATDDYHDKAQYAGGAEAARTKALGLFREVLKAEPENEVARREAGVLEKKGTGDLAYFCVYD